MGRPIIAERRHSRVENITLQWQFERTEISHLRTKNGKIV